MKAIVMLLVLASTAFAYTPDDNIQIIERGGDFGVKFGSIVNLGCIEAQLQTVVNGVEYIIFSSKWQRRADESDSWADVPGTAIEGVCGLDNPTLPGEYRWVAEVGRDGELFYIASGNTLVVAGDPEAEEEQEQEQEEEEDQETDESAAEDAEDETAVETVTWGFLKSRATR